MKEAQMFEPMIELLEKMGYRIVSTAKGKQRGADIVAEREGHILTVEMKGDTAALDVDLGTGIFQLLRHMHRNGDGEYALGISEAYTKLVRQVESPLRKLCIRVLVIDDNPHQLW